MARRKAMYRVRERLGHIKKKDERRVEASIDDIALSHSDTPDKDAEFREEWSRITSNLTPLQQQIVTLRKDGYANDEIAAKLGVSQRTVQRQLQKASSVARQPKRRRQQSNA